MAAPRRAKAALDAMKDFGFLKHESKPVLKNLLKVYENNWEYIEHDNYTVLVDAILESEKPKVDDSKRKRNAEDSKPCKKKLPVKQEEQQPSSPIYYNVIARPKDAQPMSDRIRAHQHQGRIDWHHKSIMKRMKDGEDIPLHLDAGVFGDPVDTYILQDDVSYVYNMEQLTVICIIAYIGELYQTIKSSGREDSYGFVNPGEVSELFEKTASAKLTDRLTGDRHSQLYFVPYNIRAHWILMIIDLSSSMVHHLDPLGHEVMPSVKSTIGMGVQSYYLQTFKYKKEPRWVQVKGPTQEGNVECGFYILKYMRDIIGSHDRPMTNMFKGKEPYTRAELDEVQLELLPHINELAGLGRGRSIDLERVH